MENDDLYTDESEEVHDPLFGDDGDNAEDVEEEKRDVFVRVTKQKTGKTLMKSAELERVAFEAVAGSAAIKSRLQAFHMGQDAQTEYVNVGFEDVGAYYVKVADLQKRVGGTLNKKDRELLFSTDWAFDETKPEVYKGLMVYNFDGSSIPMPRSWVVSKVTLSELDEKFRTKGKTRSGQDKYKKAKESGRSFDSQLDKYWQLIETGKTPRGRYSVKARFWDEDVTSTVPDLYYTLSDKFYEDDKVEILKDVINLITQFASDRQTKSKAKYRPNIIPLKNSGVDVKDVILVGENPRGFFILYVKKDVGSAVNLGSVLRSTRARPDFTEAYEADELLNGILAPGTEASDAGPFSIIVALDPGKISKKENSKRSKTQAAVMNGVSATAIAKLFWPMLGTTNDKFKGLAEWLHRSAHSFGGLGFGRLASSSQKKKNLLFGTKETNTLMIRYESSVKRLTLAMGDYAQDACAKNLVPVIDPQVKNVFKRCDISAQLQTCFTKGASDFREQLLEDVKDGGLMKATDNEFYMFNWLATNIDYSFNVVWKEMDIQMNIKTTFDMFGRRVPLLLEAELDEKVEDYLYSKGCFLTDPVPK